MRPEKSSSLVSWIGVALLLAPLAAACSQSGPAAPAPGTGGSPAGGNAGVGGSGSGGSATGGTTGAGGAVSSGGASGGASASGGSAGAKNGGATGTATTATGGAKASGGVSSEGGANAGGATSQGGATGNGGATGKGGAGTGTVAATGGTAAGGNTAATGGAGGAAGAGGCPELPPGPTGSSDAVAGTLIQFNDDGGWCWYQDERAVVDVKNKKLVIGTVGFQGSRNGNIEATIYDMATGKAGTPTKLGNISVDDHNAPGIVITPGGNYVAMFAGHRVDCYSHFSIYNGTSWSAEKKFDWAPSGCPWAGASTNMITYSNPWYIGTSIYSMVRSVGTDPAVLTSSDDGQSWSYYGRLMSTKQSGYVAGYFKYWGNNTDRVDFVGTEAHPRDLDTSLYHGYISDGKVYNSAGTVLDASLKDTSATKSNSVDINTYTPVLKTGTSVGGTPLCRLWNHDIVRYADGTIAVTGQGRTNNCTSTPSGSDPDKRFFYARFDGKSWKTTYLVKSGPKLYADEEDYTGLSALHPDNPNIIYVSTTYNPSDDKTTTSKHEIYQGVTCDNGATWKWTPVTKGSTMDNIRPIVPKWDADHTALLWMRGTYTTAQNMKMKIVGTISGP